MSRAILNDGHLQPVSGLVCYNQVFGETDVNFSESEDQALIRDSVRKLCSNFPDEYWARHDEEEEFPWEFYDAMAQAGWIGICLLYTSPSPRDKRQSRMPSSA